MPLTAEKQSTIFHIDPTTISVRKGWNCRDFKDPENLEHVKTLAASIEANGILEPLTVVMEGDKPVLINGESRLRAVALLREAGKAPETVPVQLDDSEIGEPEKLIEQIIRNSGKPYTVLEQAAVFQRLRDLGMEDKAIARQAGLTIERVRQVVALNTITPAVRKDIQKGTVSATMVQRIITEEKEPAKVEARVKEAVQRAKAEGKEKAGPRHIAPKSKGKAAETPPAEVAGGANGSAVSLPTGKQMLRVSAKALMAELLTYQKATPRKADKGKTVLVSFAVPAERWEAIQKAVD